MHPDSPKPAACQTPSRIPFTEALRFWLKLGFVSFGGPAGQIALMHQEIVERKRWLSERRFLHALNYCMLLPGPEAQQLATYLGWLMHRTWGGIVAGVLFVLPALLLLTGLSWLYVAFGETALVGGLFYGIKPAVAAIVAQAAHRIGRRTLQNPVLWGIAIAAFVGIDFLNLPFPAIVALAAVIGWAGGRWQACHFSIGAPADAQGAGSPALIGDDTPPPVHARFSVRRLAAVLAAGALLWLLPMGALFWLRGWDDTLTQMGWFFTKAALFTFGGAYAVLPYVYQGAVEHFGWLSAAQMIDGLALGETTPGPLIMVVVFVAFIGGHGAAVSGPDAPFLGGCCAALLVTWVTFLPSFIFILAGGPLVEGTRDEPRLTAPLTAITAAVVGVILNLALFFAYLVLWPQGAGTPPDLAAAAIALGAALALFRGRAGVVPVIAASALLGLLWRMALA